jgi:1-acyl-sn-glycerol-3-phosphate acyltransferase
VDKVKQGFYFAYKLYFGAVFFVVLLVHYPILYYYLNFPKNHKAGFPFYVYLADLILILTFIWPRKSGNLEGINVDQPTIICTNHSSYVDIPMVHSVFRRHPFLILGKAELTKWPLLRLFFKHMHIPVNRGNNRDSVRSLERAKEALKNGWSVIIFPEGTIPKTVPKMKGFKNGAFEMAIKENIPILPITFLDNWERLAEPDNFSGTSLPGISRVVVHDLIETSSLKKEDLVALKKQVFNTIEEPMIKNGLVKKED